ncbi:pseudouridine synthase [Anaeromyxobacter dehalogenans 2CP-1]|uniref:Pseudouridine synthase n=1 Tax=Anaeromyxobacter dehalogenans (strain ATCC BAA-258 / DSM 21875 / 2CP-1) TaxID=455488 RepID=B8J7X1_ANAD2|nr:pseudouridine synthase [Anaeromyxobacter dehalogenans 2CP-1]
MPHGLWPPAVIFSGRERTRRAAGGEAGPKSTLAAADGPRSAGPGRAPGSRHLDVGRAAGPVGVLRRDRVARQQCWAASDGPGGAARAVAVRQLGGRGERAVARAAVRAGRALPLDLRRGAGEPPYARRLSRGAREEARPAHDAGAGRAHEGRRGAAPARGAGRDEGPGERRRGELPASSVTGALPQRSRGTGPKAQARDRERSVSFDEACSGCEGAGRASSARCRRGRTCGGRSRREAARRARREEALVLLAAISFNIMRLIASRLSA